MKRAQWLWLAISVSGVAFAGCGDDDGPTPDSGTDSGGDTDGGMVECALEGQTGPCCYRQSNESQLADPELRIAFLALEQPPVLASPIIANILNEAVREERFNWLIRLEDAAADGAVTITTGYGRKSPTNTFGFAMGDADMPGDPNRWDPQSIAGTLAGESVSTEPLAEVFTVPVQDDDGSVILELPLRGFRLVNATLSEQRSCIGRAVNATRFDATSGEVETYITVEDAKAGEVNAGGITASLCNILRGALGDGLNDCDATPRAEWATPPNSTCDEAGACTFGGGCTAETCNAWQVVGGFAAQGVDITN